VSYMILKLYILEIHFDLDYSRRAGCWRLGRDVGMNVPTPTSTLGAVTPLIVTQGHFELQICRVLWSLRD